MLSCLYIENVAIIKSACLDFSDGINVVVGQTGSGKSVILDCIELVTGGRARSGIVRPGEHKAVIIAHFENVGQAVDLMLQEAEIEHDDEAISIKRVVYSDGKSSCFICETPVSLSFANKIANHLIEVSGQFAQGRLLDASEHIKMLDEYAGIDDLLLALKSAFLSYLEAKDKHKKMLEEKDKSLLSYEYNRQIVTDLDLLGFIEGEENLLVERKASLAGRGGLLRTLEEVVAINSEYGLVGRLKQISNKLSHIRAADCDDAMLSAKESVERSAIDLSENISYIMDVVGRADSSEVELEKIEDRLYQIRQLCRRYKVSSTGLTTLHQDAKKSINAFENIDTILSEAEANLQRAMNACLAIANDVSKRRKEASLTFVSELQNELAKLKMEHAKMDIIVTEDQGLLSVGGINSVCFAASTNPGMPIMPINKIASGGEISRFMLAFKSVMSDRVSLPAIVFDEIDAGTSGVVAAIIADYLHNLAKKTQVIAVTHNHQVVKRGGCVFRVNKRVDGHETMVDIECLDEAGIMKEVETMISGTEAQ